MIQSKMNYKDIYIHKEQFNDFWLHRRFFLVLPVGHDLVVNDCVNIIETNQPDQVIDYLDRYTTGRSKMVKIVQVHKSELVGVCTGYQIISTLYI
jgi:hypothetical protein